MKILCNGHYAWRERPEGDRAWRDRELLRQILFMQLSHSTILQMDEQHLRIKRLFGTSENAVKTQIWIAVSVYVLVAIVKKKLQLNASFYILLQTLSVTCSRKCTCSKPFRAAIPVPVALLSTTN